MRELPFPIGIAKLVHSGDWILEHLKTGPDAIEQGGLRKVLDKLGSRIVESKTAELTPIEANQYGIRNLLGLASRHLADIVANQLKHGLFTLGLLPNCNGLMGIAGGFQRASASQKPLRVGLVWMDAHGDMNTPETSLSGLLAGMPVAIATGLCLERLRQQCGLEVPLRSEYVTMAGVRATDPLEQEIIDQSNIHHITVEELRHLSPAIGNEMTRLSKLTDLIYIHIDLDVLDPVEVPGHGLTAKGGPTSKELGACLEHMFTFPKAAGLGIACYPVGQDPQGIALRSVYTLIEHAIRGAKQQEKP